MATTTEPHFHRGTAPEHNPAPLDPEHDIDAKSSTIWVLGGTIVLFIGLWVMLPIFSRVLEKERMQKIEQRPNTELIQLREQQNAFLRGANPKKKTIEQALSEALHK
ncbi:MAG: hypothetical protein U1E73_02390 [Planctomycetota bacterium]